MLSTVDLPTDPCYLATARRGKFLLAAYYEGRGVSVHAIGDDGAVIDPPIERRETARGAHSIQTDPSNRFAFVPHIAGRGPNEIWQFHFDEQSGSVLILRCWPEIQESDPSQQLTFRTLLTVGAFDTEFAAESHSRPTIGPASLLLSPSKDLLYSSNEQGCSVTAYHLDTSIGTLTALQTVSTLPDGYTGQNSCSQIQIDPSGKFLYAPNRGHNSIAAFTVNAATGLLTPVGQAASVPMPRAFSLDPDGKFFYAAGLESGRLATDLQP